MERKAASGIMLTLLLAGMLTLTFNAQPVKASGTIYIRADGSVEGTTDISSSDNITYTFTANIYDSIVVERDNIVVDGAGYTLQGTGSGNGIDISYRSNVRLKNVEVTMFYNGIHLSSSSNNTLVGNTASNNRNGILLKYSNNNTLMGNNSSDNEHTGIAIAYSSNKTLVVDNTVYSNGAYGILLVQSTGDNTLVGNTVSNNYYGIAFQYSDNNVVFHNNLIDNYSQTRVSHSVNTWDNGYPSGGNYWSDHVAVDDYSGLNQDEPGSDGIADEPYIINADNRDNYPLAQPWSTVVSATIDIDPDTLKFESKGRWITAYVELPEDYSVDGIDVSSLMLNDVVPAELGPTAICDHDNDGIPDLMVKFDRAEVESFILDHISLREAVKAGFTTITLTITGELSNGTPFEGSDTVKIICTVPQKL